MPQNTYHDFLKYYFPEADKIISKMIVNCESLTCMDGSNFHTLLQMIPRNVYVNSNIKISYRLSLQYSLLLHCKVYDKRIVACTEEQKLF